MYPKAGTSEKNWSIYNHCPLLQNILKQMCAVWEYGRNRQTAVSLEAFQTGGGGQDHATAFVVDFKNKI